MNLLSRVFEMVIGRESSKKTEERLPAIREDAPPGEKKNERNIVIAKDTTNDEINTVSNQCYNNDEKRD